MVLSLKVEDKINLLIKNIKTRKKAKNMTMVKSIHFLSFLRNELSAINFSCLKMRKYTLYFTFCIRTNRL